MGGAQCLTPVVEQLIRIYIPLPKLLQTFAGVYFVALQLNEAPANDESTIRSNIKTRICTIFYNQMRCWSGSPKFVEFLFSKTIPVSARAINTMLKIRCVVQDMFCRMPPQLQGTCSANESIDAIYTVKMVINMRELHNASNLKLFLKNARAVTISATISNTPNDFPMK